MLRKIKQRKARRVLRTKRAISNRERDILRVSVFRSNNHIYAQIIDDMKFHTIASCSSYDIPVGGTTTKSEKAFAIGVKLAEKLKTLDVKKVVFDRGGYLYHGRVKALADGLRNGGIEL